MLRVHSEVGRLRSVLLHRPGAEIDLMAPSMMDELLFDDILDGEGARSEHETLQRVCELAGVDVCESAVLLAETLELDEPREQILAALSEGLPRRMVEMLSGYDSEQLARSLVEGIRLDSSLSGVEVGDLFEVVPLPNWCFQRDPQVILGDTVAFSSMATPARWREAVLSSLMFRYHPRFAGTRVLVDPTAPPRGTPLLLGPHRPHFEGGDVLVLSRDLVVIGISERTNLMGLRKLARALRVWEEGPRWVVAVTLPRRRAYMHLDTLFTQVDRDACLIYAPVIVAGSFEEARVYDIDLHSTDPSPQPRSDLLSTLRAHGMEFEPIACGGTDALAQQREQWTDGANAFALAPGVITMYDRNRRTADELSAHGFDVAHADELIRSGEAIDLETGKRRCILLPSHELSRARGGPHCLSHPLQRDPLN